MTPGRHEGLHPCPRATTPTRSSSSSRTTWRRRSSRSTRPASSPSSRTPRPRTRCSSTWSSPAPASTARAGWSRAVSCCAENLALEFLAELAGMPEGSGGAFVSGGSLGNLSSLTVGRDVGRAKRPNLAAARGALRHLLGRALEHRQGAARARRRAAHRDDRRPPLHARQSRRGDGERPESRERDRRSSRRRGRRTPASWTTSRVSAATRANTTSGSTSTAPTVGPRCSRRASVTCSPGCDTPTASSSIRTSGSSDRSTVAR